jgi:hypothetical protein
LVLQLAGTRTEVRFEFKNERLRCVHSVLVAFRNWCPAPVHTNGYLVGNEIGLIYYLLGSQPIGGCSAIDTDSERWIPGFLSLQGRKAFYEAAARAVSAFQSHVLPDPVRCSCMSLNLIRGGRLGRGIWNPWHFWVYVVRLSNQ